MGLNLKTFSLFGSAFDAESEYFICFEIQTLLKKKLNNKIESNNDVIQYTKKRTNIELHFVWT